MPAPGWGVPRSSFRADGGRRADAHVWAPGRRAVMCRNAGRRELWAPRSHPSPCWGAWHFLWRGRVPPPAVPPLVEGSGRAPAQSCTERVHPPSSEPGLLPGGPAGIPSHLGAARDQGAHGVHVAGGLCSLPAGATEGQAREHRTVSLERKRDVAEERGL